MTALLVAPAPLTPRAAQLRAALDAEHAPTPRPAATTLWAAPWARTDPLPSAGDGIHVIDLHDAIITCPGALAHDTWCLHIASRCRGATLALVGSPQEHGFWSALFAQHAIACPLAIVPYAPPKSPTRPGTALSIASPWIADPALRPMLDSALAWAASAAIPITAGPAPTAEGALALAALALAALALAALAPTTTPPALLLDLRPDTQAARVTTPTWVIDALAAGIPVLTTVDGPLGQTIAAAGAGRILTTRFEPPPEGAAQAAANLAQPTPTEAAAMLHAALALAQARSAAARHAWTSGPAPQPLGPEGRVLVLSDEAQTVTSVRVDLPMDALLRRGAIAGYAVLHQGEITRDTDPSTRGFDAIWLHRSSDASKRLLLELLGRPFIYDIDDNLLSSPRYRPPFHPVAVEATKDFLRRAAIVSCATPRLGRLLAARLGDDLADRLVITPNLAAAPPATRSPGPPNAIIWASSDRPALAGSIAVITRALRDHCLAHGTRLICLGAEPLDTLRAPGLDFEHIPVLPPAEYRARLRALSPAILVCPLETGADPDTQDFIDGKSDIKLIEALSDGLVPVVSRAAPFLDSPLQGAVFADNTYESWLAALQQATAACHAPGPEPRWPEDRDATSLGLAPWAAALARARLEVPVTLDEIRHATAEVHRRRQALIPQEEFDEADYLANYEDVSQALAAGQLPSGYAHYAAAGRQEGRYARKLSTPEATGEAWWATLLREIGRLEAAAAPRAAALAGFERRLALRRALAAKAAH